jgi:hypothetical protein
MIAQAHSALQTDVAFQADLHREHMCEPNQAYMPDFQVLKKGMVCMQCVIDLAGQLGAT